MGMAAAQQPVLPYNPLPTLPETSLASLTPQQQLRVQQQAQHIARRMYRDPFQPVRLTKPRIMIRSAWSL